MGRPIVKYRDTAVICEKMAEPIDVPFALSAQMRPRNHALDALDGGSTYRCQGTLGYNFGCMIASDTLFDSRGRFSGSSYTMKT